MIYTRSQGRICGTIKEEVLRTKNHKIERIVTLLSINSNMPLYLIHSLKRSFCIMRLSSGKLR